MFGYWIKSDYLLERIETIETLLDQYYIRDRAISI